MTLPDPPAPRKRRLGLYLPFLAVVLAALVYSAGWFWLRMEAGRQLDLTAETLRQQGYSLTWKSRTFGGYPFRLDASFEDVTIRDPSGWALTAPRLDAEAFVYALNHWVATAPQGVTFTRPRGGPVVVRAEVLRASLVDPSANIPRLSVEGHKLTFAPAPGAQPFALASAEDLQFHVLPGPNNEGGLFFRLDGAKAAADTLVGRIAGAKPVSVQLDLIISKASALAGDSWANAWRAWSRAGGAITVRTGGMTAGDAVVTLSAAGPLTVGPDGRVIGAVNIALKKAPAVITAMGVSGAIPPDAALAAGAVALARTEGDSAQINLQFQAGVTTLGPVIVAPAPKVF